MVDDITEYEKWLGNPTWIRKGEFQFRDSCTSCKELLIKKIEFGIEGCIEYFLTSSGHIHRVEYESVDSWSDRYSVDLIPDYVLDEAEKIRGKQQEHDRKKAEEREERRKHDMFVHFTCPKCNRNIFVSTKIEYDLSLILCTSCHKDMNTISMNRLEDLEFQYIPTGSKDIYEWNYTGHPITSMFM